MYVSFIEFLLILVCFVASLLIGNTLVTRALLRSLKQLQFQIDKGPPGFSRFAITHILQIKGLVSKVHFHQPIILRPKLFFMYLESIEDLGKQISDSLLAFSFRGDQVQEVSDQIILEQNSALITAFLQNVMGSSQTLQLDVNYGLSNHSSSFSPSCEIKNLTSIDNQIPKSGLLHLLCPNVSLSLDLKGITDIEIVDGNEIVINMSSKESIKQSLTFKTFQVQ